MHLRFKEVSGGQKKGVSFEQFIRFMVEVTEDQNTAAQVFQSFKEVADGKVSLLVSRFFVAVYPSFLLRGRPNHIYCSHFPVSIPHLSLPILCRNFEHLLTHSSYSPM